MEDDTISQKQSGLDLKEIRQIVDMMAKNDLSFFHLERGSSKIELRRGADFDAVRDLISKLPLMAAPAMAPQMAAPSHSPLPAPPPPSYYSNHPPQAAEPDSHGPTINSPMVGTFYRSTGPGEKSLVSVGDTVDENTVVCIIEAMKIMNEIKAEARGTVARVLVDDSKPVQYGQPLFELK